MRKALGQRRTRGAATGAVASIPVPLGGWNARDALQAMDPKDARTLENWLVDAGRVHTRPGSSVWSSGLNGPVETLMTYAASGSVQKLFAATPTSIYDVTATGAVGAAAVTGLANGRWQHVNHSSPAGTFLTCVNGQDAPRQFNGTTWSTPAITGTGLTASNLVHVCSHMNRLWFIEKGTLKVWYLGVQAITGAATLFDITSFFPKGGELVAMDTWTRDGGEGPDDYAVFVSSEGEILIFAGISPASSTTWALAGRYTMPRPIGRRCTFRFGAELLLITEQGIMALSQVMGLPPAAAKGKAVNDKISGAFAKASTSAFGSFGWQIFEHPAAGLVLVNVPDRERASQSQYVFSTLSGGWSKFTGLNGGCWGLASGSAFFGGNSGSVYRLGGTTDSGSPILATYEHAFVDLKSPASEKVFSAARPILVAPPGYVPAVHIRTDFDTRSVPYRVIGATAGATAGADWDTADWDTADWAPDTEVTQAWQTVEGAGRTVSVAYRVAAKDEVALNGTQLLYEKGGVL